MQGAKQSLSLLRRKWLPAVAAFIVLAIVGVFGVGVYAAHSTPTTSEDSQTVSVNVIANTAEVQMASAEPIFTSEELTFEEFNAVGLQWSGENPDLATMELRINGENGWTDWYPLERMGNESKDNSDLAAFSTMLVFSEGTQVQFRIYSEPTAERAPEIEAVKVITINSLAPIRDGFASVASTVDAQSLDIVTREEWGANEDYRYSGGEELWPVSTRNWEKYIVHHTAGTDGGSDPSAVVRGIYYYHAVSLGWGDIGYNFLIDPDGRIYQGRYGGDDVIGGHAYNEVTGTSYNVGTMGVSVLGCYNTTGGCSDPDTFNSNHLEALGKLIGTKAGERNIDPEGSSVFSYTGETFPNVVGHRDVDNTACPGDRIENQLPAIREKAAQYAAVADPDAPVLRGKFISETLPAATFIGNEFTSTVTFQNTGTRTWKRGYVVLKIYDETGRGRSDYRHSSWPDYYAMIPLDQRNVAPGEYGTFTYTSKTPSTVGNYEQVMKLAYHTRPIGNGSSTVIASRVDSTLYGRMISQDLPPAVLAEWRPTVHVEYKNLGIELWNDRTQLYMNGQPVDRLDTVVRQWRTAEFSFTLTPPQEQGIHNIYFELRRDGTTVVPNTRKHFYLRVD